MQKADQRFLAAFEMLREGALSTDVVAGWTHDFYRYPARFSPSFAAAAIAAFSKPGDLVLDSFMGGATTLVEALAAGRRAVGCDLNSLSVFLARAKTANLDAADLNMLDLWLRDIPARTCYRSVEPRRRIDEQNLRSPGFRALKKAIELALDSVEELKTEGTQTIARCIILSAAQWALDSQYRQVSVAKFREKLVVLGYRMCNSVAEWSAGPGKRRADIIHDSAENLLRYPPFTSGEKADLVVTSPPYPGVHVLYHRWQVAGRRETTLPYVIASSYDGQPGSFYTFSDRRAIDAYFEKAERAYRGIRDAMKEGAFLVQLLSFANPHSQLPRFLRMLERIGFEELRPWNSAAQKATRRIWRRVPSRRWHATLKGALASSREVVLVHQWSALPSCHRPQH